jgi:heat shock protein HslJ
VHRALPILACLLPLLAACRSAPEPRFQEDLLGSCWVLVSMDDAPVPAGVETTLCFDAEGRVTGAGGCNDYFAAARFEGDRLEIGRVGATRKACEPARMDHERRYFARLAGVRRWNLAGDELELHGEDPPPLRFRRQ